MQVAALVGVLNEGLVGIGFQLQRPHKLKAAVHKGLSRKHGTLRGHPVEDQTHTGPARVPHLFGGEVDSLHQRAAVYPLLARVPTLDTGRIAHLLAHVADAARQTRQPVLREGAHLHLEIARQLDRVHHQIQRTLDLLEAGALEEVGLEQRLEDRPDLVAGVGVHPRHRVDSIRVPGGRVRPCGNRRLIGHKEVVQVPRNEPAGGGLPDDYIYDVLAVETTRLPEERFQAVVMVRGAVLEAVSIVLVGDARQRVRVRPPGECPRRRLHVVLRVVPDAH